ncbi:MAG: thioredoxin domain-containing protein [Bauldia sp.]|nr:thioredoxin domain-containing protein [Bauldia sp.]
MTGNLLSGETSPYLLQHKDNPVHWRPWGPEALAEAQHLGRPILLSIGYAACHWCHVMAHESFEDPATAEVMNRLFVNIKVDREERPDIDAIYMAALHALGEQGGWPLTMFLTPTGEPVWGGTYFPNTPRYGRAAFVDVLEGIARIFADEPERIEQNRAALLSHLRAPPEPGAGVEPGEALLMEAADRIVSLFDPERGGLRGAPKFPQPSLTAFLWRMADRGGDAAGSRRAAVMRTLTHLCQGGIWDHVGGGLCRYSTDDRWLVPHFEKMLYDNAQLLSRLAAAYAATGEPLFRIRIEETVAWLLREMRVGDAFASSLDADSPGGEGAFYVWRPAEVAAVLGPDRAARFCAVYDITEAGNFEGASIPNRLHTLDLQPDEDALAADRAALLADRNQRPRPTRDDKVLADWNGLAIAGLVRAGLALDRPDWVDTATRCYRFIAESMSRGGRLGHSWRDGRLVAPGFATDHAAMIHAALALHLATGADSYLGDARGWVAVLDRHYWDEAVTAYRLTADDAPALITRPLPLIDESVPSANGMIAEALVRLWHLTGDSACRDRADALLHAHAGAITGNVLGTASLLSAIDQRLHGAQIVVIGTADDRLAAIARRHAPEGATLIVVPAADDLPHDHPAFGKGAVERHPTAYVCRGETCSLPVTAPDQLRDLLIGPAQTMV